MSPSRSNIPPAGRRHLTVLFLTLIIGALPAHASMSARPVSDMSRSPISSSPPDVGTYTPEQKSKLKDVRTILLGREGSTDASLDDSPYDVLISVKLKLEAAGYQVVLDPKQSHDAVFIIEYRELPGRQYPNLEVGTKIACALLLYHPNIGRILSYALEAESSWPRPFGSLYWDAVQNLEENAYLYYLGELTRAWLTSQIPTVEVFSRLLLDPPLIQSLDGSDNVLTSRMAANQNARLHAIGELGHRGGTAALETLWHLVWDSRVTESRAAIAAIGEIGHPSSVELLKDLAAAQGPLRAAAISALDRMRPH